MEINEILKLEKEDIKKLKFNQIMDILQNIVDYFQRRSEDIDIEEALEFYKISLNLMVEAKTKLSLTKKEKEKIDKMYQEALQKLEEGEEPSNMF